MRRGTGVRGERLPKRRSSATARVLQGSPRRSLELHGKIQRQQVWVLASPSWANEKGTESPNQKIVYLYRVVIAAAVTCSILCSKQRNVKMKLYSLSLCFHLLQLTAYCQNRPASDSPRNASTVEIRVTPADSPATLSELVRSSQLIVVGKLIRLLEPRLLGPEDANSVPVTDHLFRVTERLKGAIANGAELLVTQTGGKWKGSDFIATDLAQFQAGGEAVLFLLPTTEKVLNPDGPPRYYVNGLWAGAFLVKENRITATKSSSESLRRHSGLEKSSFLVLVRDEVSKVQNN